MGLKAITTILTGLNFLSAKYFRDVRESMAQMKKEKKERKGEKRKGKRKKKKEGVGKV